MRTPTKMFSKRKNGVSVLIACQNEEVSIAASIISFLPMADEIVVVDNGSTDGTKEIAQHVSTEWPSKVRFFDRPSVQHLFENRQLAFEESNFRWVVRADADYVCYTEGRFDCRRFRDSLLSQNITLRPTVYWFPQPNLFADFDHTVSELRRSGYNEVLSSAMPRVYSWFPTFRFRRMGRWEGVRLPKRLTRHIKRPDPIWMHCDIKSDINYFLRSQRTNWRELGDFKRYPTLESFIKDTVLFSDRSCDMDAAANSFTKTEVLTCLKKYDREKMWPYPSLVLKLRSMRAGYTVKYPNGTPSRIFNGPPDTGKLIDFARKQGIG